MRCTCLTAMLLVASLATLAEGADAWMGKKAFWKPDTRLMVGSSKVERGDFKPPQVVSAVKGDWLWVGSGWLRKADAQTSSQALEYWSERIRKDEYGTLNWLNRGLVYMELGKTDSALLDYDNALLLDAFSAQARIYRAAAWLSKGRSSWALADLTDAIRIDPDCADAYLLRAPLWLSAGDVPKAVKDFDRSIKLDPASAEAHLCRGNLRRSLGEFDEALSGYTAAMRNDPQYALVYCASAWLRAACPDVNYRDGAKAVVHATKACELTGWKDRNSLAALAASYAEQGYFARARKWQARAIELTDNGAAKGGLEQQLKLYQAGLHFRMPAPSGVMVQYVEERRAVIARDSRESIHWGGAARSPREHVRTRL